jgi:hypothetical protein
VRRGGGVIWHVVIACFSARNLVHPAAIMMWFPSTCHVTICILYITRMLLQSMMRHDFMPWPQQMTFLPHTLAQARVLSFAFYTYCLCKIESTQHNIQERTSINIVESCIIARSDHSISVARAPFPLNILKSSCIWQESAFV